MRRVWACVGSFRRPQDYRWMSVAEFHRSFRVEHAAAFVGQVARILRGEALDYSEKNHFYRGLRNIFAEIDGMGKLFRGERGTVNTAENGIAFGIMYLGRVEPRYADLFGLLVDMYRHGLAHTHVAKCFRFRDARNRWITIGWAMSDMKADRVRHLTVERREPTYYRLWLHVPKMVEDTLMALQAFRSDLQKANSRSLIFRRFKMGYIGMAGVFREPVALIGQTQVKSRNRKKVLSLKHYSSTGLAHLKNEISSGNTWNQ